MPYLMIAASLFTTDGIIKFWIERKKKDGEETPMANGKIVIKKYHNKGAMFDMGNKNQHNIAMLSLVFSAFMTGIFTATLEKQDKRLLKTGLAFIIGGAYSNTYDRLKRKYVVDYVSFHINTEKCRQKIVQKLAEKWNGVVFNLSDFGIFAGALILTLCTGAHEES